MKNFGNCLWEIFVGGGSHPTYLMCIEFNEEYSQCTDIFIVYVACYVGDKHFPCSEVPVIYHTIRVIGTFWAEQCYKTVERRSIHCPSPEPSIQRFVLH